MRVPISSRCTHRAEALQYAEYVASAECQRTLYFDAGGQPGHRKAWLDDEVNRRSANYFRNTLAALDTAWLRPRYNGYLHFQDHAGHTLHAFLRREATASTTIAEMNQLYQQSRSRHAAA